MQMYNIYSKSKYLKEGYHYDQVCEYFKKLYFRIKGRIPKYIVNFKFLLLHDISWYSFYGHYFVLILFSD